MARRGLPTSPRPTTMTTESLTRISPGNYLCGLCACQLIQQTCSPSAVEHGSAGERRQQVLESTSITGVEQATVVPEQREHAPDQPAAGSAVQQPLKALLWTQTHDST